MKRTWVLVAITALALACSDAGGVDSDAIASPEKAAVQRSLDSALANDSLYPTLALLVFPYIDRAAHLVVGSDTMRVVNIELDIDATTLHDSSHTVARSARCWLGADSMRRCTPWTRWCSSWVRGSRSPPSPSATRSASGSLPTRRARPRRSSSMRRRIRATRYGWRARDTCRPTARATAAGNRNRVAASR